MEPLGSLSNHIQAFNFLSITLSSKTKNKKNHPQSFPSPPGISLSHTCRLRRGHLTGSRRLGKAAAHLLRLVLVIQGRKSGAKWPLREARIQNVYGQWPPWMPFACLAQLCHQPARDSQKRSEKWHRETGQTFHLSPGPTRFRRPSAGLLIPWASHDQHKA